MVSVEPPKTPEEQAQLEQAVADMLEGHEAPLSFGGCIPRSRGKHHAGRGLF